jgi:HSP20 family protein
MSLVKFKKRRPSTNLIPSSFFDTDDFFGNSLMNMGLFDDNFWNGKTTEPAMNIVETDKDFEIELVAPGFSKKDFKVSIDNGYLNISAEKSSEKEEKEKNYTCQEFSYNSFERSLLLPDTIKDEDVKAKYNDGILSFKLMKKEETKKRKPKMIEVS